MINDQFNLFPEQKRKMMDDIRYFFKTELDEDIGEIKGYIVLDFILENFGIELYNKGIEDAKTFIQSQAEELYSLEKARSIKKK